MLLSVRDLRSGFFLDEGELWAVDGISFDVDAGETVGLVGESGCGKTIVALSLLDLIAPPGRVVSGQVMFDGRDLLRASREEMRKVRGGGIGIVFQEAAAALNPVYRIGDQIADVLRLHRGMNRQEAWRETVRVLGEMGIPEPEKRARSYPFELSGGMKQRAMIAIAMAGLVIASRAYPTCEFNRADFGQGRGPVPSRLGAHSVAPIGMRGPSPRMASIDSKYC